MTADPTEPAASHAHPDVYFAADRLQDGRYRVVFIKKGASPRTSYTSSVGAVVTQAERAGFLPVDTSDLELQQACRDRQVPLIVR